MAFKLTALYLAIGWVFGIVEWMSHGIRFRGLPVIMVAWPLWAYVEIGDWLMRRKNRYG